MGEVLAAERVILDVICFCNFDAGIIETSDPVSIKKFTLLRLSRTKRRREFLGKAVVATTPGRCRFLQIYKVGYIYEHFHQTCNGTSTDQTASI